MSRGCRHILESVQPKGRAGIGLHFRRFATFTGRGTDLPQRNVFRQTLKVRNL